MLSLFRFPLQTCRKVIYTKVFRCFRGIMEAEENDTILQSHEKLTEFKRKYKSDSAAITKYLNDVNFPPVEDFKEDLEWFNVSEPLSFSNHLRGKVVVLDFFTYCCINCMHILPDLKEIEGDFSVEDGLVVVGVHSAKFANEKVSSNILAAVQRYNIAHPVVNDYTSDMWRKCSVNCWPTLLVLGPKANPLLMLVGEGHKDELRMFIDSALQFYKSKGEISNHKLPVKSAFHLLPDLKGPLLFPGKITSYVTEAGQEILGVSDTGNNRILILKGDGSVLKEIGGKKIGFKDASLDNAEFNAPQGLVFRNEHLLYVADTENHAIRLIDLKNNSVTTVAGTGAQGNDQSGGNMGTFQEISSPWDLCIFKTNDLNEAADKKDSKLKEVLIIALAGTHQIWALFLDDIVWWKSKKYKAGTCVCIAGSGREENRNNQYPHAAAFAQPSGLALSSKHKEVYIADSESSSVRKLSLVDGKVSPVAGGDRNPNNLFAFGDKDGVLYEAKLQHVLGLTLSKDEDTLFVADTYNHKVKKINLNKNALTTLCGTKAGDVTDGITCAFNEPAGLCFGTNNKLFVADTNNHSIKVLQLNDDLSLRNISKLQLKLDEVDMKKPVDEKGVETVQCKKLSLSRKGGKLLFNIALKFEGELGLTEHAPQKWSVHLPNLLWSCVPSNGSNVESVDAVVNLSPSDAKDEVVKFVFNIVTCTPNTCLPKHFVLSQPVEFLQGGESSVEQNITVCVGANDLKVC